MALPGWAGHRRRSFVDARDDGRRMEVTWHSDARVLVLSLWQDQTCRSTFRMPVEDAPAMIGALSAALGETLAVPRGVAHPAEVQPSGSRRRQIVAGIVAAARRRARPHHAEVVPFTSAKTSRSRQD